MGEPMGDIPADVAAFREQLFAALYWASKDRGCEDWFYHPLADLDLSDEAYAWENSTSVDVPLEITFTVTRSEEVGVHRLIGGGLSADTLATLLEELGDIEPSQISNISVAGNVPASYVFPADPSPELVEFVCQVRDLGNHYIARSYDLGTINKVITLVGLEALPPAKGFTVRVPLTYDFYVRAADEAAAREKMAQYLGSQRRGEITAEAIAEATIIDGDMGGEVS
jgi:hypothetical protein